MTQIDHGTIDYKDELVRKLIHLSSLLIPVIYYFISRTTAAIILGALSVFAITLDLSRYFLPEVGNIFYKFFGFLLRKHELDEKKKNLNGATYVLISALIGVLIFPKVVFITAFTILIIGDTMAALIGRKFGKHKFLYKSLEGTLAFFISSCVVVLFTPKAGYLPEEFMIGFIGAFIGAIVENISFGYVDDNLSIPLVVGFVMWILYSVILPNVELTLQGVPG
ncbi:cytidylyltransferase family protein [bacterium BMS3Abin03]|nr:cytidylyltransferase family protein [bacterium BMS3Abin03]